MRRDDIKRRTSLIDIGDLRQILGRDIELVGIVADQAHTSILLVQQCQELFVEMLRAIVRNAIDLSPIAAFGYVQIVDDIEQHGRKKMINQLVVVEIVGSITVTQDIEKRVDTGIGVTLIVVDDPLLRKGRMTFITRPAPVSMRTRMSME